MNVKILTYFKLFISFVALILPTSVWADNALEEKITRLNAEQRRQISELQDEVRDLRGRLEDQEHQIKSLSKTQLEPKQLDPQTTLQSQPGTSTSATKQSIRSKIKKFVSRSGSDESASLANTTNNENNENTANIANTKINPNETNNLSTVEPAIESTTRVEPITSADTSPAAAVSTGAIATTGAMATINTRATSANANANKITGTAGTESEHILIEDPDDDLEVTNQSITKKGASADLKYQQAYNAIKLKEYDSAISLFLEFLQQYPESNLVPNAHYWMGEAYLIKWRADNSSEIALQNSFNAFNTIVTKYSSNRKVQDALLKMGIIEVNRGNLNLAKNYFERVKREFPDSTAASLASIRLKKLQDEGKT